MYFQTQQMIQNKIDLFLFDSFILISETSSVINSMLFRNIMNKNRIYGGIVLKFMTRSLCGYD